MFRPVPVAFLLCFIIVISVVLSFSRSYRSIESLIRAHFLMPEEIYAPGPIRHDSEAPTSPFDSLATHKHTAELIPRIIHQTYKTVDVPDKWLDAYNSCKATHQASNWTHVLWTDEDAANFIAANYPWFFDTYTRYPYAIQRADAMRYFILHHYGGFYLDLDVGCRRDLSPLLKYAAIFPKTKPFGVSNDVMAAAKGHPLFQQLISSLKANSRWFGTKYPTVIFSTGPMFVSLEIVKYLRTNGRRHGATTAALAPAADVLSVRILHPTLYSASETSFFTHYRGSTWHGSDVMFGIFVWHNKVSITALFSALLLCVYFLGSPPRYNRSRRALMRWISDPSRRND